MKNRVSRIVKQIVAALGSIAKAKSMALKSKTTALKSRIVIFSLLRDKKIMMSSISHKLQALVGHREKKHSDHEKQQQLVDDDHDQSTTLVMYTNKAVACSEPQAQLIPNPTQTTSSVDDDGHVDMGYEDEDENKYPDLTHSLFEMEDMESIEEEDPRASVKTVIDMVKNSKEEAGEEFKLEDDIDNVADIFIKRFYRQMLLQKQQSLKRYQEMLLKSA